MLFFLAKFGEKSEATDPCVQDLTVPCSSLVGLSGMPRMQRMQVATADQPGQVEPITGCNCKICKM